MELFYEKKVLFYSLILRQHLNFNLFEDDTTLPEAVETLANTTHEADRIFILENKVFFLSHLIGPISLVHLEKSKI